MTTPPTFASLQEFVSRLPDVDFWQPYVAEILERHGITDNVEEMVAGNGGTYPTFLYGDVAVKLFGHTRQWRNSYAAECAAQAVIASDPEIAAPRVLADGQLYEDADDPWCYLVTSRMSGVAWEYAELSFDQKLSIATDLGRQIRRVHALRPSGIATHEYSAAPDVKAAAERSSLPTHLVTQIDDYLAGLGPFDRVFVHGDLMFRHVFVDNGRLTGIIDWGDAMVTDRHYEFAKMHLDLFNCNKVLLRAFLAASDWPMARDFSTKAMGFALYRQAHGLAQHHTMDVFYMLPDLLPLHQIRTLDELASELFAV